MDYLVSHPALSLGAVALLGLVLGGWLGLSRARASAGRRIAELEEQVATSGAESERLALDSARLTDRLTEVDLALAQAGERADRAMLELTDASEQLATEKQRVASFEALLRKRDRRVEELGGELSDARATISDHEAAAGRWRREGEEAEAERAALAEEGRRAAAGLAAAQALNAELETALASSQSLAADHQSLAADHQSLEHELEELRTETERLRPFEAEKRRLGERASGLEQELEQVRGALEEATRERQGLDAELEAARSRVRDLELEKEAHEVAADAARRQLESQRLSLDESRERLAALEDRVSRQAELEAALESLREELGSAAAALEEERQRATTAEQARQAAELARDRAAEELEAQLSAPLVDVDRMATVKRVAVEIRDVEEEGPSTGRPELLAEPRGAADDLSRIRGIGEVLAGGLNSIGVYHFRQIAAWTDSDLEWVTAQLGCDPGRIERDGWREQAAELAEAAESREV